MGGIIQFIRGAFLLAIALGIAGTLGEATGVMRIEAAKAYRHGGISFKRFNQQLMNPRGSK